MGGSIETPAQFRLGIPTICTFFALMPRFLCIFPYKEANFCNILTSGLILHASIHLLSMQDIE